MHGISPEVVQEQRVDVRDGHPAVFIEIDEIIEKEDHWMADELRVALVELVRNVQMDEDADPVQEGARVLGQASMGLEVSQQIGAERYERTPERVGQRDRFRERPSDTRVGTIELKVPKAREAPLPPSLLLEEARRGAASPA